MLQWYSVWRSNKLVEMLGSKKSGLLTRQESQTTETRAHWEPGARGKGKTHRSCAVVKKKKKITSGDELKLQRTNQPEMETSQVTRADEKTGQPKLLGTEQRDRQTDTALFPSPWDL